LVKVVNPYGEPSRVLQRINYVVFNSFDITSLSKGITDEESGNTTRKSNFQETARTIGGNPSLNNLALKLGNMVL
jgi:hypothetical protein